MKFRPILLTLVCLLLSLPGSTLAGGTGGRPALPPATLADVPVIAFPALDLLALRAEDQAEYGDPLRFAVPREVDLTPADSGAWTLAPDGDRLWRLRLSCPRALSLNLGFTRYHLAEGAQLRAYAADGTGPVLSFDDRDNRHSGQLWTPVLLTDALVVELEVPAAVADQVVLRLGRVGCGYRYFGEDPRDKSGSCNIDVICDEGDGWREEIPAIASYSTGGSRICTGVMVNNTAEDERPLFLTAHHCGVSAGDAPSVVVYWNYESPVCGEQGGGDETQTSLGSTLLASYYDSDFTLLELDESPDPVYGVTFAGWDRRDYTPQSAVAIHHPQGDEKSISFENDPLSVTTYLEGATPGNGTHLRVEDWDLGTTEVGSSGSPLFDAGTHRIVGQLHGGYASCTDPLPDWYGRMAVSWEGGGSAATRLRDHLDPLGTGALYLDRMGYEPPEPDPGPLHMTFAATGPNPFRDETRARYTLSKPALVRARVMNMHGRPVRDLGNLGGQTGENTVVWDGLDDDGHPVAAGLYFLLLESEGQEVSGRMTRLR